MEYRSNSKMKKIIPISFTLLFATGGLKAQLLQYDSVSYFINGINIPWHNYNNDFGTNYLYGANYNPVYFDSVFTECQNYGVNCVRVWLHTDGGTTPEFDSLGFVTGLDTNFFSNLDDFFQRAQNHNIMVIPAIWSFEMMNNDSAWGKYGGMHSDLIQDTLKTKSYINNVLIPMVTRYANQCNLLAWEIINEPEWATTVSGNNPNLSQHVPMTQMQRFVGMLAEAVHTYSPKMVTVGSASLKWNSDKLSFPTICIGNFWKDAAIKGAYNKPLAYLDFYEIHYYDWMKTIYQNYDPYDYTLPYWGLDKPTLIGETPGISSKHSASDMLYNAFIGNYAGALFWSFYDGGSGNGNFNDVKNQLLAFRNAAPALVDFQGCSLTASNSLSTIISNIIIFPNPFSASTTVQVRNAGVTNYELKIFDVIGKEIHPVIIRTPIAIGADSFVISREGLPSGLYFLKVTGNKGQGAGEIIATEKLIITN